MSVKNEPIEALFKETQKLNYLFNLLSVVIHATGTTNYRLNYKWYRNLRHQTPDSFELVC